MSLVNWLTGVPDHWSAVDFGDPSPTWSCCSFVRPAIPQAVWHGHGCCSSAYIVIIPLLSFRLLLYVYLLSSSGTSIVNCCQPLRPMLMQPSKWWLLPSVSCWYQKSVTSSLFHKPIDSVHEFQMYCDDPFRIGQYCCIFLCYAHAP
jgi:hypothetical protein